MTKQSFDPLAGMDSPRASILSIWTHRADAEEGTPWRVWQRPQGALDEPVTHTGITYGPYAWRCTHNRGLASAKQALPILALQVAGVLAADPQAQPAVMHGDVLACAGMQFVIGTVDGDTASAEDLGLDAAEPVAALVEQGRAARASAMS